MLRDASNNSRLREDRKQRFEPTLARHSGRLVKLPGDGALVVRKATGEDQLTTAMKRLMPGPASHFTDCSGV